MMTIQDSVSFNPIGLTQNIQTKIFVDEQQHKEKTEMPVSSMDVKDATHPKAVLMQLIEQKESGAMEENDFNSQLAEMKMEVIGSVLNLQA